MSKEAEIDGVVYKFDMLKTSKGLYYKAKILKFLASERSSIIGAFDDLSSKKGDSFLDWDVSVKDLVDHISDLIISADLEKVSEDIKGIIIDSNVRVILDRPIMGDSEVKIDSSAYEEQFSGDFPTLIELLIKIAEANFKKLFDYLKKKTSEPKKDQSS